MRKIAIPGVQLSASAYNELAALVYRFQGLTAQSPLELNNAGGSPSIRFVNPAIKAYITNTGTGRGWAYSWYEVLPDGIGGWSKLATGRNGTIYTNPAFESNGCNVYPGMIVTLLPGVNGEYYFDAPICFTPSSSSSSSSSSISSSLSSSSISSSSSSSSCACSGTSQVVVTAFACVGGVPTVTTKTICIPNGLGITFCG